MAMGTIDLRSSGFKKLGLLKEKLVELEKFIKQLTDFRDEAVALVCSSMDSFINKQETQDSLAVDSNYCDLDPESALWDKVLGIHLDAIGNQTSVNDCDLLSHECGSLSTPTMCIPDSFTRNTSNVSTSVGFTKSYVTVATNTGTSHSNAATSTFVAHANAATSTDSFIADSSPTNSILHTPTRMVYTNSGISMNASGSTVSNSHHTYTNYFADSDVMVASPSARSSISDFDSGTSSKGWEIKRPIKLKLSKKSEEHPWKVRFSCTPKHVTIFDTDALEKEFEDSSNILTNALEPEHSARDNCTSIKTGVETVPLSVEPTEKVQRQTRSFTSSAVHNKTKSVSGKNCTRDENDNITSMSQPKKKTKLIRDVKSLKSPELRRTRNLSPQKYTASKRKLVNSSVSSRKEPKAKNKVRCLKNGTSGANANLSAVNSTVQKQVLHTQSSKPCKSKRNVKAKSLNLQLKKTASKKNKCSSLKKCKKKSTHLMKTQLVNEPLQKSDLDILPQSSHKPVAKLSSSLPCVVLHDIMYSEKQKTSNIMSCSIDDVLSKTEESFQPQASEMKDFNSAEFIPFTVKQEPEPTLSENLSASTQAEISGVSGIPHNTPSMVSCFENFDFDVNDLSNDSYSKTYFKYIEDLTSSTHAADSSSH